MRRGLCLALVVVIGACGGDDDAASPSTAARSSSTSSTSSTSTNSSTSSSSPSSSKPATTTTAAPAPVALGSIKIALTEIARLDQPLDLAVRKGHPGLYIAEKGGRVHYLAAAGAAPVQVVDIDVASGGEQGLLGITFSPDGSKLYMYFTKPDGDGRLHEISMGSGATDIASDPRVLLDFEDHFSNHNGGRIAFGPDGRLYLGLGDGGGGGDPDGHGQDPNALNGKLLRFDLANAANPERYAIGLRNPWRFSFDRATGDIWIGDVGQGQWEEIDRIVAGTPSGVNLGWNRFEGTHAFAGSDDRRGLLFPVFEYSHDEGQSVVGGFVYRGERIPALRGVYLFTDTYAGNLRALRLNGDKVEHADLGTTAPGGFVVSFGESAAGELYVLSLNGGVYRIDAG